MNRKRRFSCKMNPWFKTLSLFGIGMAWLIVATACSQGSGHGDDHQITLEPTVPVQVEVLTEPTAIKTGEPVRIMAKVTQGDEPVEDAERVKFELWRDGQEEEEHVHMDGEHQGEGIYAMTYTFEEPGTYYVIPHTDARGMHTMPTATLQVGE